MAKEEPEGLPVLLHEVLDDAVEDSAQDGGNHQGGEEHADHHGDLGVDLPMKSTATYESGFADGSVRFRPGILGLDWEC